GNMTEGVDNRTIDGFKYEMIDTLIEKLKTEQYYPKPVRRTYIPKKNGKTRPLGIPSFEDKLLQEVIRQLLESIYEPIFSDNSHGFRPDRSCHTALCQIKNTMRGANWVIEGDVTGCFDNIDHTILLNILSQKIEDGRFIELIRRFLKAGYLEFKQMHRSLSGCPQGGIISPILSNIYLNEFDKYMDEIINKNTKGKKRKSNPEYQRLRGKRYTAIKKGNLEEIKRLTKVIQSIPSLDPMDSNFTRVKYVRYADD
ncbi:reverse transcriptase domain-containing protein, partial [Sinanaerobacter chloroacetimidivorans]